MNSTDDQRRVWAAGDLRPLGNHHVVGHDLLIQSLKVQAGERVLDVGAGTGNVTIAVARQGAVVTAIDIVADFLAVAQERANAENLPVTTQVADAQDLPCQDNEFDVVLSTFAVMFAPDAEKAAAELIRVCRPGGRIGLMSWTPDGFVGHSMEALARHQSSPGGTRPLRWGQEDFVRTLFAEPHMETHSIEMRHESPESGVQFLRKALGPVRTTFDALDEAGQQSLTNDLIQAMARFNTATDGSVVIHADYLQVLVTKAN